MVRSGTLASTVASVWSVFVVAAVWLGAVAWATTRRLPRRDLRSVLGRRHMLEALGGAIATRQSVPVESTRAAKK
jgi:hypothetical protein